MTNIDFLKDVGTLNQKENKIYNVYMSEFYGYGVLKEKETKRGYVQFLKGKKVCVNDGINNYTCKISEKIVDKENEIIIFKLKEFFTVTGVLMIPINDPVNNTVINLTKKYPPNHALLLYTN